GGGGGRGGGGLGGGGGRGGGGGEGNGGSAGRFVIVGAARAGASGGGALRGGGLDGEVVLVGAESRLPYSRPPLSKGYLRGQERFEDGLVNPAELYAQQRIELRLGVRATRVDPARKIVSLDGGGEMAFDRLLVATGGPQPTPRPPRAGRPGPL